MANCDPFVIWRDVPKGAKLTAKATGDTTKFDLTIRIVDDNGKITRWDRSQLVPGPISMTLPIPAGATVTILLSITAKTSVKIDLSIDDGHSCSWTFSTVGGHQVKVDVLP